MDMQQFELDSDKDFEGVKKDVLIEYCDGLDVKTTNCNTVKDYRNALLRTLGRPELVEKAPEAAVVLGNVKDGQVDEQKPPGSAKVPFSRLNMRELINLNLSPQAKWEGKRMRLILQRQNPNDRYLPVGWSGNVIFIPYDVEVSIPMPHFNSLLERKSKKLKQKTHTDEDSGSIYMENKWIPGPGYPMSPLGVDPKTAHLPASPREQYEAIAIRTNNFKGIQYPGLQMLAKRMRVAVPKLDPRTSIEDAKEALRWEMMRKIGIEPDIGEYLGIEEEAVA